MRRRTAVVLVVLLACVLAMAFAPPAFATSKPEPIQASGQWIWEVQAIEQTVHPSGSVLLKGYETGVWTGTFDGTTYEPFVAMIMRDGALWANIWIHFDDVWVNGTAHGAMTMMLTVYSPPVGNMGGKWTILDGHGELMGIHGSGGWEWSDAVGGGEYWGTVWLK